MERRTIKPFQLIFLLIVAAVVAMATLEDDYLRRVDELNLFLYSPLFFRQQMVVPGGMLTYLGTYFTQYFHYPWLGSALLGLWLGLMVRLMKRAFRLKGAWQWLLMVPVAMVVLTCFDLGYWIYYLKLRGHFFVAVIGTSMAVGAAWIMRGLSESKILSTREWLRVGTSLIYLIVASAITYILGGFYGILATVLMLIMAVRSPGMTTIQRVIAGLVALLLIWLVPALLCRHVYYQTNSDFMLWQALPVFSGGEEFSSLHVPYLVLFLSTALLAFCGNRPSVKLPVKEIWLEGALILLSLASVWSCWHWWYKDETFHEELRMTACTDRQDWEGVLDIMRQHDGEPTRMMVMYKNLALFKLGRAGDELYHYADGSRQPACDFPLRIAQMGGKNIYLYYGLPNYCYRWCLEDGVEFGWRAEHLKFLLRCALLNGEHEVARKYLNLLKQTRFHSQWASRYEPMLADESGRLVAEDSELGPILPLMGGGDVLGSDQSLIELFMLNLQAYRQTDEKLTACLALLSAMQLKDIDTFWHAFFQYAGLTEGEHMPTHFQEAAYLYGHLEHKVDISGMPFDKGVVESYDAFMQMAQQCHGMSNDQMKEAFRPRFGHTFYYNYFLMRNMKSY